MAECRKVSNLSKLHGALTCT